MISLEDAATSGLDYQEAYYDKMYKNATARNSMISAPQNNVEKKSVYDDSGIPPLTSIGKWLLEDPSAPLPQVLSTPAPAPVPLVFPAPALVPQFLSAPASAAVSQVFHVPAPTPLPQVPPTLTPVEKWLLENTSAPVHQLLPALVSAPVPQVFPAVVSAHVLPARASAPFPQVPPAPVLSTAPGHEGHDQLHNMFTPFRHGASGDNGGMPPGMGGSRRNRFQDFKGETNKKSIEALVKGSGKESLQWGLAAGMYSGLTYGLKEARGIHDWKSSAMAGAVTGAALALTSDDSSHEQVVQCAITGAAISTAANLLTGIF